MVFLIFHFFKFQITIVKNLMEKLSFFYSGFRGFYEVLLRHKHFWSTNFWRWNDGPFKIFLNFHGNSFCLFIFSKWKKYYNLTFDDTFKMYCCALSSSSMNKLFLNYGPLNMLFCCFFFNFWFMFILTRLLSKTLWKNYHFLMQIWKINFKMWYITKY